MSLERSRGIVVRPEDDILGRRKSVLRHTGGSLILTPQAKAVAIFTRPWFYKKGHDYLENGIIRYPSKLAVVEVAQQRVRLLHWPLVSRWWAASFDERTIEACRPT